MALSKQDLALIDSKFEGLAKLMNAHFENVADGQTAIQKRQDIANGRTSKLEDRLNEKDLFCGKIQAVKAETEKYIIWKMAGMIIIAAVMASIILNVGLLEFLKLVK